MPKMCCDLALESLTSAIGGLPRADRFEGCAHAIEDGGPSGSRRARVRSRSFPSRYALGPRPSSGRPRPYGFETLTRKQKTPGVPARRTRSRMVGRQGLEPWTLGLKVPCSAN